MQAPDYGQYDKRTAEIGRAASALERLAAAMEAVNAREAKHEGETMVKYYQGGGR